MGYTHYWYFKKEDRPIIARAVQATAHDLQKLLPHLPPLAGPEGKGEPLLEGGIVAFNGPVPYDYETFRLDPEEPHQDSHGRVMGFCETERRPYDLAVMVALVLLRWHAGDAVEVSSDGNLLAWAPATHLVVRHLGYPVDPVFVLDRRVWLMEDGKGKKFLVEAKRVDQKFLNYLDSLHRYNLLPYTPPFRLLEEHIVLEDYEPKGGFWAPV